MSESTNKFWGVGWSFPPSFTSTGENLVTVAGSEKIEQSIRLIIATQPGTLLSRPEFGCDMQRFMFSEVDSATSAEMEQEISDAILYFEPRVAIDNLEVNLLDVEDGRVDIVLDYTIRLTNSRYNLVYPYYLYEAVQPLQ
jgi:Bacteriophage baseplate protein W